MSDEPGEFSLGSETLKATVGQFSMAAVGFLGTIIFANYLSPDRIGQYYLLLTAVALSNRPVKGFADAVQKRSSESDAPIGEITTVALVTALGWAAVMSAAAFAFRGLLTQFVGLPQTVVAFGTVAFALCLFFVFEALLRGSGGISRAQWIDTLRSYVTLPAQLALFFAGFGALGLAYGEAIGAFLVLPVFVYVLSPPLSVPSRETVENLATFAKHSVPIEYLRHTFDRIDVALLGLLVSQAAAGNYGVVYRVTSPAAFVAMATGVGLFSQASNRRSRGQAVTDSVQNALLFPSVLALPMFAGALVLGRPLLVVVFGPMYAGAYPLLVGLLLFQVIRTRSIPLEQTLNGLNRPDIVTKVSAALLVTNVALGIPLAIKFGSVGVVVATVVAELVQFALFSGVIRKQLPGIDVLPRELLEQTGCALLMAVVTAGSMTMLPIDGWPSLCAVLVVSVVAYFGSLIVVSRSLRVTLRSAIDVPHLG